MGSDESDNRRFVLIMDASRDDSLRAIGGVLKEFSLRSGDNLTVLAVLHQVNSPMGYWVSVDSSSITGTNEKIAEEARVIKEREYNNKKEIIDISEQCEEEEIGFHLMVLAGKLEALEKARVSQATWVILDKEMKRDRKLFLDGLSCRVSRMKRDYSFQLLRGPKEVGSAKPSADASAKLQPETGARGNVKYHEMIPGSPPKGRHSHHKISKDQFGDGNAESHQYGRKSASNRASSSSEQLLRNYVLSEFKETTATEKRDMEWESAEEKLSNRERAGKESHDAVYLSRHKAPGLKWIGGFETNEDLVSICSKCDNRRPRAGWKKEFTYAELLEATKGFSDKNFLSEGGFGAVYKGEMKNGMKIAVKQHKSASDQGDREFKAEVYYLSTAIHENLVMLLGSCAEGNHRLLVYEYVCNGSLDVHLSKYARKPLSWEERMKIATGAANGLLYLHQNNIVHRDVRPNNILLTHDYNAMLGDFGLARTQQDDHTAETSVVGTLGYLAPEYAESGRVSTKTDVYAFGVILLQLITGRGTNDKSLGDQSLVGWVSRGLNLSSAEARPLLKDKNYPDLIDPKIMDSHDFHQLFWMVRVAEKCLTKDPRKRLAMDKVVYALKYLSTEADAICQIKLSPEHSDSSPRSSLESPDKYAIVEDEDNDVDDNNNNVHNYYDQASRVKLGPYKETNTMSSDYDNGMSGGLSKSSSSQSISSERSSMSTVSELFSLDNGLIY